MNFGQYFGSLVSLHTRGIFYHVAYHIVHAEIAAHFSLGILELTHHRQSQEEPYRICLSYRFALS